MNVNVSDAVSSKEKTLRLKSERQKRHYLKKKEKQKKLVLNLETTASSLAAATAENEQLTFTVSFFTRLLHSADQFIADLGRLFVPQKRLGAQVPQVAPPLLTSNTESTLASQFVCTLLGLEEPSQDFWLEISKQSVEVLADIDRIWLMGILNSCKLLVINPGDLPAKITLARWAKRRKRIVYDMYRKRAVDLLDLAYRRALPLHSDGTLNPRLYDLPRQMKLTSAQHEAMRTKWRAYQSKSKEPFLNASSIPNKASSPLTVLDGIQALQSLNDHYMISASELVHYCWGFVEDLEPSQRACTLAACAPYAPDLLQISAVLFDE